MLWPKLQRRSHSVPTLHYMYTGCQRDGPLSVELPQMSTSRLDVLLLLLLFDIM